ncbi:hypothetical protein PENTCL1PPCAC_3790, partial [Pristionchus entomophagus]
PLLAVRVHERVVAVRIPERPLEQQVLNQESVLRHNPEVGEEGGESLDHSNLPVRQRYQPFINQFVRVRVSRLALHDVRLGLLVSERDRRY